MTLPVPWRGDTTENASSQADSRYETPGGSQAKADEALNEMKSLLGQAIIQGDSGPEAYLARYSTPYDITYPLLKDRLDASDLRMKNLAIVNVKDFGAMGDGITDDTAAIQNAINYAAGFAKVYLPAGSYLRKSEWKIPSNTIIEGEDETLTVILTGNNLTNTGCFSFAQNSSGSIIRNLTIQGNRENQTVFGYGIKGYLVQNCVVENVTVTKQYGIGVGWSNCRNMRCTNVEVTYCGNYRPGFWCDYDVDSLSGGHVYEECDAHYNDLDGFICNNNNVTIRNSRFTYNGQNKGPTSIALGAGGIYNDRLMTGMQIINCTCKYNTEYGINGIFSQSLLSGNTLTFNALSGIYLRPGSIRVRCIQNLCYCNGTSTTTEQPATWGHSGIQFDGCQFIQFVGNSCYDDRATASSTQVYGIQHMNTSTSNYVLTTGNNFKFNKVDDSNYLPAYGNTYVTNSTYADNI